MIQQLKFEKKIMNFRSTFTRTIIVQKILKKNNFLQTMSRQTKEEKTTTSIGPSLILKIV
jgi:hypothetical protein